MSDDLNEFLSGLPKDEIPTAYIRVQHSSLGVSDVPVDENVMTDNLPGMRLSDVLALGNLTWNRGTQFFMGETEINPSTIVPVYSTVTAVGILKGG